MREEELESAVLNRIPKGALAVAKRIEEAGGRACLVGGSIRDLLLGGAAKDWDLATDLNPERVRTLFPRSVEVGIRFGTVLVLEQDGSYEVTTFRKDGLYSDARHPDTVSFSKSLEEDLSRRDFTINALAFCLRDRRLIDPHSGREDLKNRLVRCVGRAEERFREDALRLLRCVRIAGQLGFAIEVETYAALVRSAEMLDHVAAERIRQEFDRILTQPRPSVSLERLHETGLLDRFLPELASCYGVHQNPFHAFDVFYHSLSSVDQAPSENRIVRLAALFHDLGKVYTRRVIDGRVTFYNHQLRSAQQADAILRRLRYPNEERERAVHLVRQHMFHYSSEWTDAAVRRFVRTVGRDHLDDLFATRHADSLGNGLRKSASSKELDELRRRIQLLLDKETALSVRDLAVNGNDLKQELGLAEGPAIGRVLDALLEEVLEDPQRNDHEVLMQRAREIAPGIVSATPPRGQKEE
jgi:poly(A) polymerase/tRNA nucleotidyltransferase (CCA-adding enzyme)